MLIDAFDLISECSAQSDAAAICETFRTRLQPLGARSCYVRAYATDAAGRAAPSRTYYRHSPPGWEDAYASRSGDSWNPIARAAALRPSPFRFREVSSPDRRMDALWEMLEGVGIPDGLAIPCHGPGGSVGLFSLGFQDVTALSPRERMTIELSAVALHGLIAAPVREASRPAKSRALSARERDCIAFVAEGKSDWEISVILGIAQSTAHLHVENAKRKLGATTRAQAVAHWLRTCC